MARARTHTGAVRATGSWGQLLSETALAVVLTLLLYVVLWQIPGGRGDLSLLGALAVGFHAVACLRLGVRIEHFLALVCPACSQNFHGYPERSPVPFRRRCAHCGHEGLPSE